MILLGKVEWIKLSTEMFSNPKIKYLRSLPEGNNLILIWCMLLAKAGHCNAKGYILLTEHVAYTPQMLANEFDFDAPLIQMALNMFQQLGMVEMIEDTIYVTGWVEHQNVEGLEKIKEKQRIRTQRCREKKKLLALENNATDGNVTGNVTPCDNATLPSHDSNTKSNVTLYIELEKEKDNKYIEQMNLLWSIYPNKKGKEKAFKKMPKLINKYGYEQIKRCVERYAFEKQGKDKQYIAYGSTFFTSTYADYLDCNFEEQHQSNQEVFGDTYEDPETGEIIKR